MQGTQSFRSTHRKVSSITGMAVLCLTRQFLKISEQGIFKRENMRDQMEPIYSQFDPEIFPIRPSPDKTRGLLIQVTTSELVIDALHSKEFCYAYLNHHKESH